MKKLYRSLSLIVFLNIGSIIVYNTILLIIVGDFLNKNEIISVEAWFILSYLGVIYLIGLAANAPILFINSSDYREAYLKEFNLIKIFFHKIFNNKSTPIQVISKDINNKKINQIIPISA
uniref:Serpentine receptor class gamma n=1 Tax=Meloidogyne floridensis TaxID=298350 RepID=A0A915NEA3_9BILA